MLGVWRAALLDGVGCGLVGGVFAEADADRLVVAALLGVDEGASTCRSASVGSPPRGRARG